MSWNFRLLQQRSARRREPRIVHSDEFHSEATTKVYAHLHESFRHLRARGISRVALDEFEAFLTAPGTLSRPSLIVRCCISNGNFDIRTVIDKRISRSRVSTCLAPFVERVLSRCRGHADFFVLISDNLYVSEGRQMQCLEYFKRIPFLRCDRSEIDSLSMHCILIPDYFVQHERYASEWTAIEQAVRVHPFRQRQAMIKWRGCLSNSEYPNLDNYRRFPRYLLLTLSARYPDIVDARLTEHDFADAALRERMNEEFGPPVESLHAEAFVAYKYLISVDGVGAAWKRVATILASGSVLLLHHRWTQFFNPALTPWVHYVPLEYDLSDLLERYEWLEAHPAQAQAIAENGRRVARAVLRPAALETYFAAVVNECGALCGA
jgi:hypothetical protein